MEIWTGEENELRELDNMMNPEGKSCKNCYWSGYEDGDIFITCGHHISNFTSNSFCCYHTNIRDKNLTAYLEKRKKALREKFDKRK